MTITKHRKLIGPAGDVINCVLSWLALYSLLVIEMNFFLSHSNKSFKKLHGSLEKHIHVYV
mgnify:CR=1 FL=1